MVQRFSIIFKRTNQNVSGVAYWPLSPILRSADVTLTKPLTLPRPEALRATKHGIQVILFAHRKMPVFEPKQRVSA